MRRLKIFLSTGAYRHHSCLLGSSQVPATPAGGTSDGYARVVDGRSLKGTPLSMRKIAVVSGFAAGAALALAPLASADLGDTVTSTLGSEIGVVERTVPGRGLYSAVCPAPTTRRPASCGSAAHPAVRHDPVRKGRTRQSGTTSTHLDFGEALYGVEPIAQAGLLATPGSSSASPSNGALTPVLDNAASTSRSYSAVTAALWAPTSR